MLNFIYNYIKGNYILLVLSLIVFLLLIMKSRVAAADFRPMHITLICVVLFTLLDRMETLITDMPEFYTERLILSVVCYWLRPAYALGLIYVIETDKRRRILLFIPELINILFMGLAFIPGVGRISFYFNDEFCLTRGPLGYTVFVVGGIYVLILLFLVLFRLRNKKAKETILVAVCAFSIVISSLGEVTAQLRNVTPTLVVASCLVYYLMIYIQMTSVDGLTGLYNRETFNADSKNKNLNAIISIDMNGLKELNDFKGHEAGDRALAAIGRVIGSHVSLSSKGYRVGGDEFIMTFKNTDEETVKKVCGQIREEVKAEGCSVAAGYAFSKGMSVEEMMRVSDQKMYEDKDAHYGGTRHRR